MNENPHGCFPFICRAPGSRICPWCEPALYATFYKQGAKGEDQDAWEALGAMEAGR